MQEQTVSGQKANLERLLEDLKAVVRDGQQLLKIGVTEMKAKAIEQARTAEVAVRDKPYQSLGLVFALGMVVGMLAVGMCNSSRKHED